MKWQKKHYTEQSGNRELKKWVSFYLKSRMFPLPFQLKHSCPLKEVWLLVFDHVRFPVETKNVLLWFFFYKKASGQGNGYPMEVVDIFVG